MATIAHKTGVQLCLYSTTTLVT